MVLSEPAFFLEPNRRQAIAGLAAMAAFAGMARPSLAGIAEDAAPIPSGQPFSFDLLTEAMRARARQTDPGPLHADLLLPDLDYDSFRRIQFNPQRARWADSGTQFRLHAFQRGWLFTDPVALFELRDGVTQGLSFTTSDFLYRDNLEGRLPPDQPLPAAAGWRLAYPLNEANVFDEVAAFLGASYFRVVGQYNLYGASARGLALNTATGQTEEFPRFSAFYIVPPVPGSNQVTFYAALDSTSVTGAYQFVLTVGDETDIEITARLFFRNPVAELGIAPLTSMFLFDETNRVRFDDYRPQVHDSNGLRIRQAGGGVVWRPLANPPRLASSYFAETSPLSFGLHQRDRRFSDFEDAESHFERRPSIEVEPIGDWGEGNVRLVEIPSDMEYNDNIVAYWVPKQPVAAGDEREYRYRLRWGVLPMEDSGLLAHVVSTHTGVGGVSGGNATSSHRKFVIDFGGGTLAELPPDADLTPRVSTSVGEISQLSLSKVDGQGIWRLVMDVSVENRALVELSAAIEGYGQILSESWKYQWVKP